MYTPIPHKYIDLYIYTPHHTYDKYTPIYINIQTCIHHTTPMVSNGFPSFVFIGFVASCVVVNAKLPSGFSMSHAHPDPKCADVGIYIYIVHAHVDSY